MLGDTFLGFELLGGEPPVEDGGPHGAAHGHATASGTLYDNGGSSHASSAGQATVTSNLSTSVPAVFSITIPVYVGIRTLGHIVSASGGVACAGTQPAPTTDTGGELIGRRALSTYFT